MALFAQWRAVEFLVLRTDKHLHRALQVARRGSALWKYKGLAENYWAGRFGPKHGNVAATCVVSRVVQRTARPRHRYVVTWNVPGAEYHIGRGHCGPSSATATFESHADTLWQGTAESIL